MLPHALELPEILFLIGSFLPIWVVDQPGSIYHRSYQFKPAPLCRCLRVSKFWYDTLVPILWYGHWTENRTMTFIPPEAIGRHCHLLKVLQVRSYDAYRLKSEILGCTNLIELSIFVDKNRQTNGQIGRLPESQLLRSNPLLKRLTWAGECSRDPRLNPEDFVGLENLERLDVQYWDCSGGRLAGVLRAVSGTLKELSIGENTGLKPGSFSSVLLQDDVCHDTDTGAVSTEHIVLRLGRLEKLEWSSNNSILDCAAELVKFCPNLKTLELGSAKKACLVDLAKSLRIHCPYLDSVAIPLTLDSDSFKTFFHRCSTSGLRALDIASSMPDDDLISSILHHASTLEDLRVSRKMIGMDGRTFLPLLVECTNLKRLVLDFHFHYFENNPLEALKQEKWGCRGLEVLDLHFGFLATYNILTEESEQEFRGMAFAAGWEMVPLSYRYRMFKVTHLPKVFELLEVQELDRLQTLVLEGIPFRRLAQAKRLE